MSLPIPSPVILSQSTNSQVPWRACVVTKIAFPSSVRCITMTYSEFHLKLAPFFTGLPHSAILSFSSLGALKPPKRLQGSIGAIVFANPCGLVSVTSPKGSPEQSPHSQSVELVGWLNDCPSEVDGDEPIFFPECLQTCNGIPQALGNS